MIRTRARSQPEGQALAEFAIVIPVFMLLVGGIIQFGMLFWGQNTLNQIVRDAGRFAATVADCSAASNTLIEDTTRDIAAASSLAGTLGTVTVTLPEAGSDPCPPTSNAEVVWIAIEAQAAIPVFFPIVSGDISSKARFRMEPQVP